MVQEILTYTSLDGDAPYALGNKDYQITIPTKCEKCKTQITKDNLKWNSGYYDGYHWTSPMCPECYAFLPHDEN